MLWRWRAVCIHEPTTARGLVAIPGVVAALPFVAFDPVAIAWRQMIAALQLEMQWPGFALALTFPVGLVLTAFAFGVRHGFDWDHIAAISDLSGSAENRRRGLTLSMMYALGHAAAVLVLGLIIVVLGSSIPSSVADPLEQWMGRVVGLTLVALGLWILIELARKGRDFRLRSRWMLVLQGTFAGFRRVHRSLDPKTRRTTRHLEVEHEHAHAHAHAHSRILDLDAGIEVNVEAAFEAGEIGEFDETAGSPLHGPIHEDVQAHDHAHLRERQVVEQPVRAGSVAAAGVEPVGFSGPGQGDDHSHRHSHSHRHKIALGDLGGGAAVGIGVLHGVGIESPTQIALFTASASVGNGATALVLLVAWVVGLVVANAMLAVAAGFGLLQAERYFVIYAAVAVIVALLSIAMGAALMVDVALPLL